MNGSPDALLERYKNGEGEEQERLSWLEQAVDAGSPEAMCILGGLYSRVWAASTALSKRPANCSTVH